VTSPERIVCRKRDDNCFGRDEEQMQRTGPGGLYGTIKVFMHLLSDRDKGSFMDGIIEEVGRSDE